MPNHFDSCGLDKYAVYGVLLIQEAKRVVEKVRVAIRRTDIKKETARAYLVDVGPAEQWFPKSQVVVDVATHDGTGYIELPVWLAKKTGLMNTQNPPQKTPDLLDSQLHSIVKSHGLLAVLSSLGDIAERARMQRRNRG